MKNRGGSDVAVGTMGTLLLCHTLASAPKYQNKRGAEIHAWTGSALSRFSLRKGWWWGRKASGRLCVGGEIAGRPALQAGFNIGAGCMGTVVPPHSRKRMKRCRCSPGQLFFVALLGTAALLVRLADGYAWCQEYWNWDGKVRLENT